MSESRRPVFSVVDVEELRGWIMRIEDGLPITDTDRYSLDLMKSLADRIESCVWRGRNGAL